MILIGVTTFFVLLLMLVLLIRSTLEVDVSASP